MGSYFAELNGNYYIHESKGTELVNNNVADCAGALLLNTSEIGLDKNGKPNKFLVDVFKRMTGRDVITVRRLHSQATIYFTPSKSILFF